MPAFTSTQPAMLRDFSNAAKEVRVPQARKLY